MTPNVRQCCECGVNQAGKLVVDMENWVGTPGGELLCRPSFVGMSLFQYNLQFVHNRVSCYCYLKTVVFIKVILVFPYFFGVPYYSMIVIKRSCQHSGFVKEYSTFCHITVFVDNGLCIAIVPCGSFVFVESFM